MTDGKYPPLTDSLDDLPRTLRREREAQERAQRAQQFSQGGPAVQSSSYDAYANGMPAESFPATVVRVDMSFGALVAFFIKAVIAAIPAIILLIALLYGLGVLLKAYMPWLVQTEILIRFPK